MLCPNCEQPTNGNFCSNCGNRLPVVIGETFPFGIKFPSPQKKSAWYISVVNTAKNAPVYKEEIVDDTILHTAFYDADSIRPFILLNEMVSKMFRGRHQIIQYSTDGSNFFSAPKMQWNCFAEQVTGGPPSSRRKVQNFIKCRSSYFGCHYINKQRTFVDKGCELFMHGVDGRFMIDSEMEEVLRQNIHPTGLHEKLSSVYFVLDKPQIKKRVRCDLEYWDAHMCPGFSIKHMEERIDKLPEAVLCNVETDWWVTTYPHVGVLMRHRSTAIDITPNREPISLQETNGEGGKICLKPKNTL